MAHIVLFHSVLGLRSIEGEIAAVFEADGHVVTLPDLYGGKATDDYDAGFALLDEVGDAEVRSGGATALCRGCALGDGTTGGVAGIGACGRTRSVRRRGVFADWVGKAGEALIEMHRYTGVGHYFLDPSLDDYDEASARLGLDRSRAFLKGL